MTMEDLRNMEVDQLMVILQKIQSDEQVVKDIIRSKIYSVEKPR
jgi:hypothetical protein